MLDQQLFSDLQPITFDGIDANKPLVIAGPCSAESEEQVINTAKGLAKSGIKIFRAGIWKPRTKPTFLMGKNPRPLCFGFRIG